MKFELLNLEQCVSTNDILKGMTDAPEGLVVTALEQSGGRGRLSRAFESPLGGLYMSVMLTPTVHPNTLPYLTILCGVAVSRTIFALYGVQPLIKNPNDIYINGKKVCGILCELVHKNNTNFCICGIGLNVTTAAEKLPIVATSLVEITGEKLEISVVRDGILAQISSLYAGFDGNIDALQEYCVQHEFRV